MKKERKYTKKRITWMPNESSEREKLKLNVDLFPCTWGTFATICFTIYNISKS